MKDKNVCGKALLMAAGVLISTMASAGVDLRSTVERVKLNGDGKLWLKMSDTRFDQYCRPGWYGFNLYIPMTDEAFPYYYGLITSALAKGQQLYIANISTYDGTTVCDLTETSFGIVVEATP